MGETAYGVKVLLTNTDSEENVLCGKLLTCDDRYVSIIYLDLSGNFLAELQTASAEWTGSAKLECLLACEPKLDGKCNCPSWVFSGGNPLGCVCGGT